MLRALLGVAGPLDRQGAVHALAQQPGVHSCFVAHSDQVAKAGASTPSSADFQNQAGELAKGARALAAVFGMSPGEPFGLSFKGQHVSFAFHGPVEVGVLHQPGEPAPGLREKLGGIAKELAVL